MINEEIRAANEILIRLPRIGAYFKMTRLRAIPISRSASIDFKNSLERMMETESESITKDNLEGALEHYQQGNFLMEGNDFGYLS